MASLIENTPGHLHPLGFIIPHEGTCVVITLLRPVPGRRRRRQAGGKYAAGPAQGGSPARSGAGFWPALFR